ncbi:MAG TPA: hypothetical protein VNA57_12130 [Acidimicrobiales bacterium]|nr:hypothetical protein [Acidimicrobiales bacterium]
MRDVGEHGQCPARPLLVALSTEELGAALADMGEGELRQLFHVLGLRVPASRLRSARHSLVLSRLRSLPPSAAHMAAIYLTAAGMSPMLDVVNAARAESDDGALREGVSRLSGLWPYPLMKLLVTVMLEVAMVTAAEAAAIMALLDEGAGDGIVAEDPLNEDTDTDADADIETERDEAMEPVVGSETGRASPPAPRATSAPRSVPAGPAAAARLVLEAAGASTALGAVLVSVVVTAGSAGSPPDDLVAPAVAEMLSAQPSAPGSWFLLGLADAKGLDPPPVVPPAPDENLRYYRFLGRVTGLAGSGVGGDVSPLLDLLDAERRSVERLVQSPEGALLSAPLLSALLEADPRWAADLLSRCPLPFTGWERVLGSLRQRAAVLLAGGDIVTAELLLRSGDETLSCWAVADEEATDELGDDMQAEAAQLCLLRVTCRRARRDFAGASRLMSELPDSQLPAIGQLSAHCERALIAAELADVTELRFPRSGRERRSMLVRLERSRRHVDDVLEADPDSLVGRLLSGMHALCVGDDAAAARDLALAEAALVGVAGTEALACGARFHRALCQLRLLEPGTDESAYRQLTSAMAEGFVPVPEWLVAAAEALDAHESPLVAEAISLAASVSPSDAAVTEMVCEHARRGNGAVIELADRLAADRGRSLSSRFALLEAALDGTSAGGHRNIVEQLVDEIDDVVARACNPVLDERWGDLLGRHEGVRLLLDPLHADLLRVDVLRRVGRVEEARELLGRLFYRVAAGGVAGVDAGELLDLVSDLGAGEEELALLRPLVAGDTELVDQPRPRLGRDVRILFVGGNESQERYQESIDAALAERYEGRVVVEWFTPGWGSNWMKAFSRIESCYEAADAVVLMPYVRTLLGRRVRKTAGEAGLPWVACTAHGRDGLLRAIERAIAVVAGS